MSPARIIVSLTLCLAFFTPFLAPAASAQDDPPPTHVYLPATQKHWPPVWNWREPATFEGIMSPNHAVQSLFDAQGRLHLFWDMAYGSARFIYHACETDAGWRNAAPVAQTLGISALYRAPILGADGAIQLLWHNVIESDTETIYRLMYARFAGDAWSAEEEVYRSTSDVDSFLQVEPKGRLIFYVWDDAQRDQLQRGYRTADGWTFPVTIALPKHRDSIWPDRQGGLRFFEGAYSDDTLYASQWRDGEFPVYEQSISGITTRSRYERLDQQDNLHVFWRDRVSVPGNTINGVYHQCLDRDWGVHDKEVPSGAQPAWPGPSGADDRWFALAWATDAGAAIGLWDGCQFATSSETPIEEAYLKILRAAAISARPFRACVVFQKFLAESYEVHCADLEPAGAAQ